MTTGDIQLIREFVAASGPWYESLKEPKDKCKVCGVIPSRMWILSETLKRFLEAYDLKHGKR